MLLSSELIFCLWATTNSTWRRSGSSRKIVDKIIDACRETHLELGSDLANAIIAFASLRLRMQLAVPQVYRDAKSRTARLVRAHKSERKFERVPRSASVLALLIDPQAPFHGGFL